MDSQRWVVKVVVVAAAVALLLLPTAPPGGARRGSSICLSHAWRVKFLQGLSLFVCSKIGVFIPPSPSIFLALLRAEHMSIIPTLSYISLVLVYVSEILSFLSVSLPPDLCKPSALIITEPDVKNNGQSFVFNYTLAKAVVEYASAVYMTDLTALYTWTCSRCNDLIQGFEMTCIIVDVQNCLQAFVGVDHKINAIIVSIRGTQENSIQNWIKDILWKQVDFDYPNMPDAKVHTGFYSSYNNTLLRPVITNAVHKARKLHGDMGIIVTGHSMGGAIASFCALDLAITFGSNNVHLMSFGQPRVGNAAFASYFAKYVPNTIRMTHECDIVPHLPPYFFFLPQLTYRHFPREVWEHEVDGTTVFQVCDGSGEDPNCCRSVSVLSWSTSDHLTYMGVEIAADEWSTCRIVLGQSVEKLQMSLASNIVTSGHSIDIVIADDSLQVG